MADDEFSEGFEQLVDLIAATEDIKAVLDGLTGFAADAMTKSTGTHIECAMTLRRRKRTATIGGSSPTAIVLDRIEQSLGDGPCIDALDSGRPVLLGDTRSDPRWPEYRSALSAAGIASALGVPINLPPDSGAVLNFFAPTAGLFTDETISDAVRFGQMASKPLQLALRIATAEQRSEDLKAALETRTVIDLACGIIMAQNRCSKEAAFEILRRASTTRNQKLHTIAKTIVNSLAGQQTVTAHFDD